MDKLGEGLDGKKVTGDCFPVEYKTENLKDVNDALLCLWNSCIQPPPQAQTFKNISLSAKVAKIDKSIIDKRNNKEIKQLKKMIRNKRRYSSISHAVRRNINRNIRNVIRCVESDTLSDEDKTKTMEMLCCMIFQVRDCRQGGFGKGARYPAYRLFIQLYKYLPKTLLHTLDLFGVFGYWKDLNELRMMVTTNPHEWAKALGVEIAKVFASQIKKDIQLLDTYEQNHRSGNKPNISLAAKWAPRRDKLCDRMCHGFIYEIAKNLFQDIDRKIEQEKMYRKIVVKLNRYLGTTEIKMCEKRFQDIEFDKIPARCLNRNKKVFLGNNDIKDQDRQNCRTNFIKFTDTLKNDGKKAKGLSKMPHELIAQILNTQKDEEIALIEAQWKDHETHLSEYCEKLLKETGNPGLSNSVILADVSGSMQGQPMMLAVSMAILISRIQTGAFHSRFMTFTETPEWHDISKLKGIKDTARYAMGAPWGRKTDILRAFSLVLDVAEENKLHPKDMPTSFIIISDMQFNAACRNECATTKWFFEASKTDQWSTHHEVLVQGFKEAGKKICGKPYDLPLMIYWNARGDVKGIPVTSTEKGALMISGFASNLVKLLLTQFDKFVNPFHLLQTAMNHEFYAPVRRVIAKVREEPYFSKYILDDADKE